MGCFGQNMSLKFYMVMSELGLKMLQKNDIGEHIISFLCTYHGILLDVVTTLGEFSYQI